jgi:hypothetical protein
MFGHSFFGAAHYGPSYFGPASGVTPTPTPTEAPARPRPGDNRKRGIFKPTGLQPRSRVGQRISDTASLDAEVSARVAREFIDVPDAPAPPPVIEMSAEEIDREIGIILRKRVRTDEDEVMLLLMMAAAAVIN